MNLRLGTNSSVIGTSSKRNCRHRRARRVSYASWEPALAVSSIERATSRKNRNDRSDVGTQNDDRNIERNVHRHSSRIRGSRCDITEYELGASHVYPNSETLP